MGNIRTETESRRLVRTAGCRGRSAPDMKSIVMCSASKDWALNPLGPHMVHANGAHENGESIVTEIYAHANTDVTGMPNARPLCACSRRKLATMEGGCALGSPFSCEFGVHVGSISCSSQNRQHGRAF